jgi:hypothetical protein
LWFEIKVDAQQGLPGDPATGNRRSEGHNVPLIVSLVLFAALQRVFLLRNPKVVTMMIVEPRVA